MLNYSGIVYMYTLKEYIFNTQRLSTSGRNKVGTQYDTT
jgi:hypothetical protein